MFCYGLGWDGTRRSRAGIGDTAPRVGWVGFRNRDGREQETSFFSSCSFRFLLLLLLILLRPSFFARNSKTVLSSRDRHGTRNGQWGYAIRNIAFAGIPGATSSFLSPGLLHGTFSTLFRCYLSLHHSTSHRGASSSFACLLLLRLEWSLPCITSALIL